MEMDLTQTRYLDFGRARALLPSRRRASSACSPPASSATAIARTLEYARDLGIAFQLTNIIRDVGEDARKNRIYLPMDELERFDVPAADILNARETPRVHALMAFQAERARSWYDKAFAALPAEDRRAQRPGLIMAAIYRTLLDEIGRDGFRVLEPPHLAHAAAQVLDRMENLARGLAIVGAGYAGMAAAVTAAARGVPVTVFETGPVPGGRARRVAYRPTGRARSSTTASTS